MPHISIEQRLHNSLLDAAQDLQKLHLVELFQLQPTRAEIYQLNIAPIYLDYSKQRINQQALDSLVELAEHKQLSQARDAMFHGEKINHTEQRAVLHTALRNSQRLSSHAPDIAEEINQTKQRMLSFVDKILNQTLRGFTDKPITDVISIGIGGSFFGPKMLQSALVEYQTSNINVHYLANIDGAQIKQLLAKLNPATTLVIVASKSWTTIETQVNANAVMTWFKGQFPEQAAIEKHWVALTAKPELAQAYGIAPEYIFPLWDFVGGRYSVWSAIGLPLALSIGSKAFDELLAGAASMDEHFCQAPLNQNMPVLLALIGYWQQVYLGYNNLMVLPYSHGLKSLPAYLQQLDMESNGKSVNAIGDPIATSGPILWGAEGTNCQHSFMQLLHQGKQQAMIDFIVPAKGETLYPEHHKMMIANCLGQAQALMQGKTEQQAFDELIASNMPTEQAKALAKHKAMPGNTGSNTLVLESLTPYSVGALLALYEHKIFCQGILFGINSFDQWGVELGKQLGNQLMNAITTKNSSQLDPSTQALLKHINL